MTTFQRVLRTPVRTNTASTKCAGSQNSSGTGTTSCHRTIHVPGLRERVGHIPLFASHFLRRAAADHHLTPPAIPPITMQRMMEYGWLGNVREKEPENLTDEPEATEAETR